MVLCTGVLSLARQAFSEKGMVWMRVPRVVGSIVATVALLAGGLAVATPASAASNRYITVDGAAAPPDCRMATMNRYKVGPTVTITPSRYLVSLGVYTTHERWVYQGNLITNRGHSNILIFRYYVRVIGEGVSMPNFLTSGTVLCTRG